MSIPFKDIDHQANLILESIMSYARLDFSNPQLEISDSADVFDAISSGVNMMGQELKENVVSLKEKEHMLKEIHHRVKNNMQIISSMLRLQFSKENDERIIKMIRDSQSRIYAMALVHEMLYGASSFKYIDFNNYLSFLTKSLFDSYAPENHKIGLIINVSKIIRFEIEKLIPLGLIINEIITNSLKYAFNNDRGEIVITASEIEDAFIIEVSDNGTGFSKEFDVDKDTNLGMQLVFLLADQIDAEIKINKESGVGYKISF